MFRNTRPDSRDSAAISTTRASRGETNHRSSSSCIEGGGKLQQDVARRLKCRQGGARLSREKPTRTAPARYKEDVFLTFSPCRASMVRGSTSAAYTSYHIMNQGKKGKARTRTNTRTVGPSSSKFASTSGMGGQFCTFRSNLLNFWPAPQATDVFRAALRETGVNLLLLSYFGGCTTTSSTCKPHAPS